MSAACRGSDGLDSGWAVIAQLARDRWPDALVGVSNRMRMVGGGDLRAGGVDDGPSQKAEAPVKVSCRCHAKGGEAMSWGRMSHSISRFEGWVGSVRWYGRLTASLILVAVLICLIDFLAVAAHAGVNKQDSGWLWGAQENSSGSNPGASLTGLRPNSVRLLITISGDRLTAQCTVTAPWGTRMWTQVEAAASAGNSDAVVSDFCGQVSVAQFRNGITGNSHEWTTLGFGLPQLMVSGGNAIVTASSDPFRILLSQQYVYIARPAASAAAQLGSLEFADRSSVQLLGFTGARLVSAAKGSIDLQRDSPDIAVTLSEPGPNWTTGLRAVGGINLPIVGGPLQRLASMVIYVVLLYSLTRVKRNFTHSRRDVKSVLVASANAIATIVGAFIALSFLEFCYDLIYASLPHSPPSPLLAPALAGPAGLMLCGAVVIWPAACWRVTRPRNRKRTGQMPAGASRQHGLQLCAMLLTAAAYIAILRYWFGANLLSQWEIWLNTVGVVILVYLLGCAVLLRSDRKGPLPLWVLTGMLAVVLASTVAWPVLVYTGFHEGSVLYVNVIGKWIYLVAALITIIGLCVLAARVMRTLYASRIRARGIERICQIYRRRQRLCWATSVAVITVTLAATVPDLIAHSQVLEPHAEGLLTPSLAFNTGLYRALPQLLNWLLLGLAIAVLLTISRQVRSIKAYRIADRRAATGIRTYRNAVRQIAIPVMMLILFGAYNYAHNPWIISNYTWLYLPITPIAGLVILTWLVLPAKLTTTERTLAPGKAIHRTLDAWRAAEFADSQRKKLISDDDDVRDALLKTKTSRAFQKTLARLTRAQNQLARRRDQWQRTAKARLTEAFDHQGDPPNSALGRQGAVTGALLGVIPAGVLLLATRPTSEWSGYPVLDFLGFTAWILFLWPALGWALGYFLPFIRGRNGINKALWVYTAVAASLPMNLLWLDGQTWQDALIYYLELFVFLLIVGVILCDLTALHSAGMPRTTWAQVHHWRFVVTWSTAVLAAAGTVAVTFFSTVATDLGQETVTAVTGQVVPSSPSPVSNPNNGS
jgi:hypothetical protein